MAERTASQRTDIQIDLESIPNWVAYRLGAAGFAAFYKFLQTPGAREFLDAKKTELGLDSGPADRKEYIQ